jgi:predicted dehydrogenase
MSITSLSYQLPDVKKGKDSAIRVGVVGCGYWGPKLARNFHELTGSRLVALADSCKERLDEVHELYPEADLALDARELMDGTVDALVIATPVHMHFPLAKAALLAGKHVLVEKPLAARSDQAQELVDLAFERGRTLMVGHTFVYNPAVEAVRQVIHSGELGPIYYLHATRANLGLLQSDINVMWDLAPHDISLLRYILDSEVVSVSARGACYVNTCRRLHEVVYLILFFENGVMANLHLSWLDPVKQRRLTVVGGKKMLVYDDIAEDKVVIFDKGVEVPPYSVTEQEFHASYRHGGESVYPLQWTEPLRAECQDFLDCIRTGTRPRGSGEDGLKVIKVLETAQRSMVNGGVELFVEY